MEENKLFKIGKIGSTLKETVTIDSLLIEPVLETTLIRIGGKDYFVKILDILTKPKQFSEWSDNEISDNLEKIAAYQYTLLIAYGELNLELKEKKLNFEIWKAQNSEPIRNTSGDRKISRERVNALMMNKHQSTYETYSLKIFSLENLVFKTQTLMDILKQRNETLRSLLRSRDIKKGKAPDGSL